VGLKKSVDGTDSLKAAESYSHFGGMEATDTNPWVWNGL